MSKNIAPPTLRELSEKIVDTVLSVRLREESVLAVEDIIKNPVREDGGRDTRIVAFPQPVEVRQPPYEPKQQVSFLHLEPVVEMRVVACMKFCEGFSGEKLQALGSLRAVLGPTPISAATPISTEAPH